LNCFSFPWKCRALKPVFSWESSNNISLQEYHLTMTFFFQCFLIHLPPSIRETVGAGTYGMAAAILKAADALWDARGGHDPTATAALTQQSRSPTPNSVKRGDKRSGNASPKSRPPFRPDFHSFQNSGNGMCKFHNYYANRANRCVLPCSWSEN
jgi:hypothetical protein